VIESAGMPIGLLSSDAVTKNDATAENVLAVGEMVDIEGRKLRTYGNEIDLTNVNDSGEVFLTVFNFTNNGVQIYSIEFIARIE